MIVSVVRIAGGMINGMVDPAWVNFWLQVEAAVAVMIVSITAYRSLFIMNKSSNGKSPKQQHSSTAYKKRLWSRGRQQGHEVQLPTLPNPALTGMRTVIGRAGGGAAMGSREEFFERCGRSIHVMREHEVTSVCSTILSPPIASTITQSFSNESLRDYTNLTSRRRTAAKKRGCIMGMILCDQLIFLF